MSANKEKMRAGLGIIVTAFLLAGCQQTAGLAPLNQGPPPPPGTPHITQAVDGLVVGHRLMAAGEYELALKAYYRAASEQGVTVDVLSALGSANLRLGRLGQAETLLREAIRRDPGFIAAWNNLGVALMERGETGEAKRVFQTAFALDSGNSDEILGNLRLAIAKTKNSAYDEADKNKFDLVRRGNGQYLLLSTP